MFIVPINRRLFQSDRLINLNSTIREVTHPTQEAEQSPVPLANQNLQFKVKQGKCDAITVETAHS